MRRGPSRHGPRGRVRSGSPARRADLAGVRRPARRRDRQQLGVRLVRRDLSRARICCRSSITCCAATQPDVLHVHNLLNLSFDLPRQARARGARVVGTLHDYTLVCPSGGQRIHRAERHVCHRSRRIGARGASPSRRIRRRWRSGERLDGRADRSRIDSPRTLRRADAATAGTARDEPPADGDRARSNRRGYRRRASTPRARSPRTFDLLVGPSPSIAERVQRAWHRAASGWRSPTTGSSRLPPIDGPGFDVDGPRAVARRLRRHARLAQGRSRADRRDAPDASRAG